MELTLESAFSTGGLVGHFAYMLLVISMLMRRMIWLRIFVILSALVAIALMASVQWTSADPPTYELGSHGMPQAFEVVQVELTPLEF